MSDFTDRLAHLLHKRLPIHFRSEHAARRGAEAIESDLVHILEHELGETRRHFKVALEILRHCDARDAEVRRLRARFLSKHWRGDE